MTRLDDLLFRWHEDCLAAEEVDELVELLQNPEERRRLVEEFCYIESVSSGLRGLPAPIPSPPRLKLSGWQWWAGAAAALLMAVTIAWWWRTAGQGPAPLADIRAADKPNQVISGQVILDGTPTRAIADGGAIRVPEELAAVIRLGDGSHAELEPGTQAVLHGSVAGLRQLVELVEGAGSFSVEKGEGQFQVETAIGRVTALGTEFRVRLLPGKRLEVAVREGLVEVDLGGRTHLLSGGDSRVFSGPGRPARETRAFFTASNAGTISISNRDGSVTLPLADNARVLLDGKPAKLADLPPGTIVFLEQLEGQSTVVGVRADGPSAGGEVRAVDAVARTISLVGRQQARGTSVDRIYPLAADVQVIIDNSPAALAELRPGTKVLLKLAVDRKTVVRIAAGSSEPRQRK